MHYVECNSNMVRRCKKSGRRLSYRSYVHTQALENGGKNVDIYSYVHQAVKLGGKRSYVFLRQIQDTFSAGKPRHLRCFFAASYTWLTFWREKFWRGGSYRTDGPYYFLLCFHMNIHRSTLRINFTIINNYHRSADVVLSCLQSLPKHHHVEQ